jgi:hypothetical protein
VLLIVEDFGTTGLTGKNYSDYELEKTWLRIEY